MLWVRWTVGWEEWKFSREMSLDFRGRRRRWDLLRVWEVRGVAMTGLDFGCFGGGLVGEGRGEDVSIDGSRVIDSRQQNTRGEMNKFKI